MVEMVVGIQSCTMVADVVQHFGVTCNKNDNVIDILEGEKLKFD